MLALGGSAVAAKLITGKQVKDRSLTGRDLRSNSVTGRVVANLSGRDILSDSLDGTDVAENQLGPVPRARSADTADRAGVAETLSGARVARVHFAGAAGAEADVAELGGLRLRADCSGSGELEVTATTASGPAWIRVTGTQQSQNSASPLLLEDDEFRTGDEFSVLPATGDNLAGQIVYLAADGTAATVTFMAEQGIAAARGYACLFAGTAVQAG